ncbi:deoxyribonuclease-1-like 1 isoform X2 [Halichoeres trimaculatus]|uniref:deoxyribonuclease-1-like 1 isoform X2 n=1 Tax=Halichoeres trimaculatus TaxID=147232 RepID=UPI003D9F8FA3
MRWRSSTLPLLLLLLSFLASSAWGKKKEFRICAYNLQQFNAAKAANHRVMHTLTRILARCDISLLQEVMDPQGKAIKTLVSALNRETDRYESYKYKSLSSKSLGTSLTNMQQYVFIYRTDTVSVLDQYQYQKKQSFVREPFAVHFQSEKTAIKKFVLVALHTAPEKVVQELDRLYDVFTEVTKKWDNQNVMFLGDFHAGCAHMTKHDKKKIRLFQTKFSWLISDKVDTTVNEDNSCAYDRIVVHGKSFLKGISPFSAKVFNFGKEFKISRSKVLEVSDHFPVEVKLKSSALLLQATPLLILLSLCTVIQSFLSTL